MRFRRFDWLLILVAVALWLQWGGSREQENAVPGVAEVHQEMSKPADTVKKPRTDPFERPEDLRLPESPVEVSQPSPVSRDHWTAWDTWANEDWERYSRRDIDLVRSLPLLSLEESPFSIYGARPGQTSEDLVQLVGPGELSLGGWGCKRNFDEPRLLVAHAVTPDDPVVAVLGNRLEHQGNLIAEVGMTTAQMRHLLGDPDQGEDEKSDFRGRIYQVWSYHLWHIVLEIEFVDDKASSFTIRYYEVEYLGC